MRIAGHRTSLALEQEFWSALERIARTRSQTLPVLIASIDERARQEHAGRFAGLGGARLRAGEPG